MDSKKSSVSRTEGVDMGDFICVCTSRIHSLFVLFIYCVIVMFMIMFDVLTFSMIININIIYIACDQ